MFGTPELTDDLNVIATYAQSHAQYELPVIDIEAILEILFASIDDIAMGSTDVYNVVHWSIEQTLDFKEPINESGRTLMNLVTEFYRRVLREAEALGMIQNGRYHFAYKAVLFDGTFLLQRAILDT